MGAGSVEPDARSGARMASLDVRDQEAAELLRMLLEELRALREETAPQTALLEVMLRKLDGIERTQYS